MKRLLAGVLFVCLGSACCVGAERAKPTLFVVGDSTANNGRDCGWGSHLGNYFGVEKVTVLNWALGDHPLTKYLK